MRMTAARRVRWPAMMIAVAAIAAAAGCASHSPNSQASRETVKGSIPHLTCTPTTIGYVGLVRPGQAPGLGSK